MVESPTASDNKQPWWCATWFRCLLVIAALSVLYVPALQSGFTWDDDAHLTQNPCIIGPQSIVDIWTTRAARICPLVLSCCWLQHQMWGLSPLPYHLVNVLMHAGAALLLWRVLLALRVPGAWLGALLWALHPVQVGSGDEDAILGARHDERPQRLGRKRIERVPQRGEHRRGEDIGSGGGIVEHDPADTIGIDGVGHGIWGHGVRAGGRRRRAVPNFSRYLSATVNSCGRGERSTNGSRVTGCVIVSSLACRASRATSGFSSSRPL